jgi:hypothetical protein
VCYNAHTCQKRREECVCSKRLSINEDLANTRKKVTYRANVTAQLRKVVYGDHGITTNFINCHDLGV